MGLRLSALHCGSQVRRNGKVSTALKHLGFARDEWPLSKELVAAEYKSLTQAAVPESAGCRAAMSHSAGKFPECVIPTSSLHKAGQGSSGAAAADAGVWPTRL